MIRRAGRLSPVGVLRAGRLLPIVMVLAVVGCGGTSSDGDGDGAPIVKTTSGTLRGLDVGGVREYRGVRFAAPARRFAAPRPVRVAPGTVDATKPGARCAQSSAMGSGSTAEDCLFADVTVPKGAGKGLPVMVWWHGGGYESGAGSDYGARRLAEQGHVIVVEPNQRLGVFGYLRVPGMAGGGSLGFADQIQSLRWTAANAKAFGGDPRNVTVFGESSGAMSVCALLTSPAGRGLYAKVAMSSGSCLLRWPAGLLAPGLPPQTPYASAKSNTALSVGVAKKLGCAGGSALACLRRLPLARLMKVTALFSDQLAYGTPLLPLDPARALAAGRFARVPVLSGGNRDEARSFVGATKPGTITRATYPKLLAKAFGSPRAGRVLREYPPGSDPTLALATVATDASWACPTVAGNGLLAAHTKTYAYEFADRHAPNVNKTKAIPAGAAHAADLPFLFDLGGASALRTASQRGLAARMIRAWTTFARTGAPGGRWTAFPGRVERFDERGARTADPAAEHRCDFWRTLR